jgi:hypothetical protein
MTTPTPPTQVPPPTPPQSTDPLNFDARADAFVAWFPTAWAYLTNLVNWITARANDISGWAATASAAAAAAFATANASMWASGATYAVGVNVIDPVDMLTYRRKTAGAGTTRPGQDASNWTLLTGQGDVLLTAPQTLSNKTLTNPTINGFTGGTQVIDIGSGQLYKDALGNIRIGSSSSEGINGDYERLLVSGLPLGSAVGAKSYNTVFYTPDQTNVTRLSFLDYRYEAGTSHPTSRNLIQRSVDAVDMGYLGFDSQRISFGWGADEYGSIDMSGNHIQSAPTTPPSLATNGTLVLNLTSNTNLRVTARCPDGVTRTANFTLS